ncbi:MAG: molecular chaperone TorD family protein [Pseudomonadota bacterium]
MADLAYALSSLFGEDTDLDETAATSMLNLAQNLFGKTAIPVDSRLHAFFQNWNISRGAFFGPNPAVPLEESVYKSWTDETGHPLRGFKGLVWGDSAFHMLDTLKRYGVDFDRTRSSSPDHLAVILEFLGFLLETNRIEEARLFTIDHLNWLEPLLEHTKALGLAESVQHPVRIVIDLRNSIIH